MNDGKNLLKEGLTDAIGFVGGSMIAFWLGRFLGFDMFEQGYGFSSTIAILLAGLGGGLGVAAARKVMAQQG